MESKDEEYREMFLAEALENYEELNNLFTILEKNTADKKAVDAIFRITHTLKGNAMGMGFEEIADLGHVMEDIFSEVKEGNIVLDADLFNSLFKANDKLGELIQAINSGEKVRYKGIRTKLSVFLNKAKSEGLKEDQVSNKETQEVVLKTETESETEQNIQIENSEEETTITEEDTQEIDEVELEDSEALDVDDELDENTPKISFSDLVQVPVRKLDDLMNLVGELIIERDSLVAKSVERGSGSSNFARLQRITSDLQYGVMDIRLIQIGFLFKKFNRIIRDVAVIENKNVDLKLEGTEIEIDRNILKIMSDSLVHLVRNSVSHGIESEEERVRKGKSKAGKVTLRAVNEKDTIIIEVNDDGNGIDHQKIAKKAIEKGIITEKYAKIASKEDLIMLIFEPGFSNAEKITEVSGRGVGMDVVKKATESIGGKIEVDSEVGKGSTIRLLLPSSMAVKGALLFELKKQTYAVALSYTEAVISLTKSDIHKISNGLMASYLGKTISVIFLNDLYEINGLSELVNEGSLHKTYDQLEDNHKLDVLVASYDNKYVGFVVDKLLQQKEIVEKTLESPIDRLEIISGATILGNGEVCLVLDIANIIKTIYKEKSLV
ncbi:MAG: chemotaxis protein CheA [Vicingaceae bacterium]|nr:chemotaxis protein CheA [Vicingaceae bacterium]